MKKRPAIVPLVLAALVALAAGCTEAALYGDRVQIDPDEVTLRGSLCTADPTELRFPVKVLFVVDTSAADGEYVTQRAASVERLARTYSGANYSFGIIRYAGARSTTSGSGARPPCSLQNLTPDGFTRNLEDAILGIQCVDNTASGRDLESALSLANSVLTGDILTTDIGVRSRTKYVVILLANGPPTFSLSEQWCNGRIPPINVDRCQDRYFETFCSEMRPPPVDCERAQYVQLVRDLKSFAKDNGVQELFFHSVYQRDPDLAGLTPSDDDPAAITLLGEMAITGGGSLYRFPGPASCDDQSGGAGCLFSLLNLDTTQAVFQRKQLIVSNRNALATADGIVLDTDADGLSDTVEAGLGTSPVAADTDGDFLSDRLEDLLRSEGLDPLVDDFNDPAGRWPVECPRPGEGSPNAFPPDQDRDGDRLRDCEENLLRSESTLYDTDADGIPDPLEFRYGTNLLASDPLEDLDADGFSNVDEYRSHLDPLARDRDMDKTYRYSFVNEAQRTVLSFSQPFGVTGVYVTAVSQGSSEGRATLYYEPPPDPGLPAGPGNAARLSWRDPQDNTQGGTDPGRGTEVSITRDGTYTLHSARSVAGDQAAEQSVAVDVYVGMLPTVPGRDDVRLHASERYCFDFAVKNVKLLLAGELADGTPEGTNYIDVFLSEVPTNNPTGFGIFRVATIPVIYAPALGRGREVVLREEDFLLFGEGE